MIPDASAEQADYVARLQAAAALAAGRVWSRMGPDFDSSWRALGPRLTQVVGAAQLASATRASESVPRVLAELGVDAPPVGVVDVRPLVGVAADGRPLQGLLAGAVGRAKQVTATTGAPPAVALEAGGRWLTTLTDLSVTDAARSATQAEIVVRDDVGWVRQINPPCCPKCAILAGQWYRWNTGMPRHPGCDCLLIPAPENVAGNLTTDVDRLFDEGQVRGLTARERERLAAGEDRVKVVNESRDMWRARVQDQRRRDRAGDAPRDDAGRASMENVLDSLNRDVARARMERMGLIR